MHQRVLELCDLRGLELLLFVHAAVTMYRVGLRVDMLEYLRIQKKISVAEKRVIFEEC
jgi:hypothetical protein